MNRDKSRKQQQFSFTWEDDDISSEPNSANSKSPSAPPPQTSETARGPGDALSEQESEKESEKESAAAPSSSRPETPAGASDTSMEADSEWLPSEGGSLGPPRPQGSGNQEGDTAAADTPKCELSPDELRDLTVGQIMQEARGLANRSVLQISQRTRIPPSFLYNVEADHLDRLPALVYTKSHLRHLCREYGLDPVPVLEKFLIEAGYSSRMRQGRGARGPAPQGEEASQVSYYLPADEEQEKSSLLENPLLVAGGAGLAAIALVVLLAFAVQNRDPEGGDGGADAGEGVPAGEGVVDYEQFVVPNRLPAKTLPIPGNGVGTREP